jgi:hypothetical protein
MLGRGVKRTRFGGERLDVWDGAAIVSSTTAAVLAVLARAIPEARWYPYPSLHAPVLDPRLIAIGAAIAMPCLLATARTTRLARASARNAAMEVAR